MNPQRCYLSSLGIVSPLGAGAAANLAGLLAGDHSGLVLEDGWLAAGPARVGRVATALPEVPAALADHNCRNNRLILAAYEQIAAPVADAVARYGYGRIGVVLGTSTSGIAEGEAAMARHLREGRLPSEFAYAQMEIGAPARFLGRYLGLAGPAYTVSTACSSGGKALAAARNLIRFGVCDAVIAGGADALCRLTINGFAALESTSTALNNPLSRNRCGLNIGEGAALLLVTREPAAVALLGVGESSDASHISAPQPQGLGAEAAMRAALADGGISPLDVDYLNLHATATPKNDLMEAMAVARVFPGGVPVSGTKPLTGHALGAAGALEAAFCWLLLAQGDGRLPPHVWDGEADVELPALDIVAAGRRFLRNNGRACLSNSFAFGGNNISLLLGDAR